MKFVIIGAMEEEITLIKDKIDNLENRQLAHLTVFVGNIDNHQVALVQCGIGKVASSAATALLIAEFSPDAVINTGSAGGFDIELDIGDVVIAESLMHHDVDVRHFGYELGQVPNMPASFACDNELVAKAKQAIQTLGEAKVKTGLILSGDSFIGSDEAAEQIKQAFPLAKAVEMEGAAIAQVCHTMNVPCVVIRSLSDIAGKTSTVSFENYLKLAAKHSASLVLTMLALA